MAYKTESSFVKAFKTKYLQNCHAVRVESGLTERGIPDMQVCYNTINVWIEFKNKIPKLRHEQLVFIHRRAKAFGSVLVVCSKGNDILIWHNPQNATDSGILKDPPDWILSNKSDPTAFTQILKLL